MICVKTLSEMSVIDYLPPQLYRMAERRFENGFGCVLMLESSEDMAELREYGLDPNNLNPGYVEIVESGSQDYYCTIFFQEERYIILIVPFSLTPPFFQDTYYSKHDGDITIGGEYALFEPELINTYTPEQMAIYVSLEAAKEASLAEMQMKFYREGYMDAVQTIYEERKCSA